MNTNDAGEDNTPDMGSPSPDAAADGKLPEPQPEDAFSELGRSFGADRIRFISADDPRLPELMFGSGVAREATAGERRLVAVECGSRGGQYLAAIICDSAEKLKSLTDANPELRLALRTTWKGTEVLWVKTADFSPGNTTAEGITWFVAGVVPIGVQGDAGIAANFLHPGTIPVIHVRAVRWPEAITQFFQSAEISENFGPVVIPVAPRKFALNDAAFTELLLRRLCLVYDAAANMFRHYQSGQDRWDDVSPEHVERLITNALIDLAARSPEQFSPEEITEKRVRHVLWLMTMTSVELPGQREVLDRFFSEAVVTCPEGTLTSEELFAAYATYCRARGRRPGSAAFFYREATRRLGQASHSHGDKGTKRGRSGYSLNWDVIYRRAGDPGHEFAQ